MQLDEQEIQFKKRARRRLVGAIALVLLMVTILPMVLDDRSSSLPQPEIEISIPSQDGEDFTTDITPYIPEPEGTGDDPDNISDSAATQELPDANVDLPKEDKVITPAPTARQTSPAAQSPAVSNSASSSPIRGEKPTVARVVNPDKAPTYSVQIGVFSDAGNVKQLEEKLKAKGLKSSTEKLKTPQGEKIRLRAGPFATRPLAEEALASVKDAGLSGMIITNK